MGFDTTNESLIRRAGNPGDEASWREFYDLYAPMLRRYARGRGIRGADADDIVQDCMQTLMKTLPRFKYQRSQGRFERYLHRMVSNRIISLARRKRPQRAGTVVLENLADRSDDGSEWDREWRRAHLAFCMERLTTRYSAKSVAAFTDYAIRGEPIGAVCERYDMTENQVYLAKSRITRRLRDEVGRLVGQVDTW